MRPTNRCISQKPVRNSLPPRQALIAAPVADTARWQLSSGKSLPLPGSQVI